MMKFPCFLNIAVYADMITKDKTITWNLDERHYRMGKKLCDIIVHALGCEYKVVNSKDGEFGSLSNGSWSGLVGMVHRGEVDIAVSEVAITEERWQVVDFSYPFAVTEVTFITEKLHITYDVTTLLEPFSWLVWTCLGLFHINMVFIFYLVFLKKYSFFKIALKTFAAFFGQQSVNPTQKISERIIVLTWVMLMMITSLTYKAVLLSILTVPTLNGVRVIPELSAEVKKGNFECTSYPGSFYAGNMLKSDNPNWHIIGQSLLENDGTSDIIKVLENVGNKKFAFIGTLFNFMHLKNKYFISDDYFFIELPAIAMRKGFIYKRKIDTVIHRMNAGGLFVKILEEERFHEVSRNSSYLGIKNGKTVEPLSLEHVFSVFIFLCIGYSVACCCFIIELLIGKYKIK